MPFINDGEPVDVVEISTGLSLTVILGVLIVTVIASLLSPRGRAQNVVAAARRHATEYLRDRGPTPRPRARSSPAAAPRRAQLKQLPEKYRARIREEEKLMALLRRAHEAHAEALATV